MLWLWFICLLTAHAGPLRVAVLDFDNGADSAELDALGKGLQSMVTTDLAQVTSITIVERARLRDLIAEQKLGADGLLDPSTAAELGKLAGATHVVLGSFTVVGSTMRLDARLTTVASGEVEHAMHAEGERDAFFELEKKLVTDLLAGLDITLSAKERATVGRFHTLEWDNLVLYSRSIEAYDTDRRDEAVALLEDLAKKDEDFKLARTTLAGLAKLIDSVSEKRAVAEVLAAERRFAARGEEVALEARIFGRLMAIGTDTSASFEDRATALYAASTGFNNKIGGPNFYHLRTRGDTFALDRATEGAYQLYWALLTERGMLPHLRVPLLELGRRDGQRHAAQAVRVRASAVAGTGRVRKADQTVGLGP